MKIFEALFIMLVINDFAAFFWRSLKQVLSSLEAFETASATSEVLSPKTKTISLLNSRILKTCHIYSMPSNSDSALNRVVLVNWKSQTVVNLREVHKNKFWRKIKTKFRKARLFSKWLKSNFPAFSTSSDKSYDVSEPRKKTVFDLWRFFLTIFMASTDTLMVLFFLRVDPYWVISTKIWSKIGTPVWTISMALSLILICAFSRDKPDEN